MHQRNTQQIALDLQLDADAVRSALERLVERAGVSRAARSQSRRHGYCPHARRDVENFLLYEWFGVAPSALAAQLGIQVRAVYCSIASGRLRLAQSREQPSEE